MIYELSIVTVCYNSESTIKRTLDSLINEAVNFNGNIQSIIIDGCSNDSTIELINDYISSSPKNLFIEFVSEPDNGIYDAMNKGVMLAKGQLIALLNSDDTYLDGALSYVWKQFLSTNFDIAHADVTWRYSYQNHSDIFIEHSGDNNLMSLVEGMTINHPTLFCRPKVFNDLGLFNCRYKFVADWVWVTNFIGKKYKISYFNKALVCFDMGGVSNKVILSRTLEIQGVYSTFHKTSLISFKKFIKVIIKLWWEFSVSFLYQNIIPNSMREVISSFKKL